MDKVLKFLLWSVGIFAILCLIGRAFIFETWTVPEESWTAAAAAPTLAGGDLVLVMTIGESKFGDLVRCPDPEDASSFVVGRVAGLGGDLVELDGPVLTINGKRYVASEACKDPTFLVVHPDTGNDVEVACARVDMGSGWHFRGTKMTYNTKSTHRKKVGIDKVFLLSDNRGIHDDSRDYGTLEHATCLKKVFFRLWSKEGWTDTENRLTFIR
jgi:signal peptidase I